MCGLINHKWIDIIFSRIEEFCYCQNRFRQFLVSRIRRKLIREKLMICLSYGVVSEIPGLTPPKKRGLRNTKKYQYLYWVWPWYVNTVYI